MIEHIDNMVLTTILLSLWENEKEERGCENEKYKKRKSARSEETYLLGTQH